MSKVISAPLTQVELRRAFLEFAQGRDTGYLGTAGTGGVHESPVKYFNAPEHNLYLHSRAGTKFENLAVNEQVCLLVSPTFADYLHKIRGVQFFGRAQVAQAQSQLYVMAEELCPWDHGEEMKLIHLAVKAAVYVDRLHGRDIKQRWFREG